ncbi:spore germination protein [Sutcliffiella horikoshii]|uniref:spore germination protein n=1 Tax=Sutcliffiella horikoshii TaxID=79883 RepID=UPI00384E6CC1
MKKLGYSLNERKDFLLKEFQYNTDIVFRTLSLRGHEIMLTYIDRIVDTTALQEHIIRPILQLPFKENGIGVTELCDVIEIAKIKSESDFNKVISALNDGNTIIMIDGEEKFLVADTADWKERTPTVPQSQRVLRGPQIGFIELANTNISLIKRIIKNQDLKIEDFQLGNRTNTSIYLLYLEDRVDKDILEEIKKKLQSIQLSSIIDASYLEEHMTSDQVTPFPIMLSSERPDTVAGNLLEGRVAIICDGSPDVLIAPAVFIQFLQSPDDYYEKPFFQFTRIVRIISFFCTIFLIPLYIAFTLFHQELIPSELLISLTAQRLDVPLPVVIETVLFMFIFEVILESSIRLATGITLAFAIIGTIILGQSAAEAGFVQLSTLVVVSATYVFNFAIPIHPFAFAIKLIRYMLVFLASVFGLYGVIIGSFVLVNHFCSINSFGVPYLSPLTPFNSKDLKDTFFRFPLRKIIDSPKKYNKDDLK